jgi:hypothetical protein
VRQPSTDRDGALTVDRLQPRRSVHCDLPTVSGDRVEGADKPLMIS